MDQQTKDPDVLNVLVLERVDRTKNMARYYVLSVEPTLFAESSLLRRWGRIGGAGRTRIDLHASPPLAQIALKTWLERKRRPGYRLRSRSPVSDLLNLRFIDGHSAWQHYPPPSGFVQPRRLVHCCSSSPRMKN